ncbi:hypothetical protein TW78_09455 [Vibrio coralliilyticus]|uniref:Uncharacterized protein n=1 Tax=Vibrio coralliilyticus TaxID=190893 RepID=A0A837G9P3_9VIBR|nr:methyl-accepting chemotaxis protein [Vibrio coralliilyticus]KJY73402.1 hypothetical protein TW78_09455 [Vibrio coralliilyticus]QOU33193.1 HAMP domain-containing protein [Vibrio coralliilyticus]
MVRHLKLNAKIGLAFAFILTLLVLVAGMSVRALSHLEEGIAAYRDIARDANLVGRVQANMLLARMHAKDFLLTNEPEKVQQYYVYLKHTQTYLAQAKRDIQQPNRAQLVAHLAELIDDYHTAFEEVVAVIQQRNQTIKAQLDTQGPLMVEHLSELLNTAYQRNNSALSHYASQVLEEVLSGRLYVFKYLRSDTPSDYDYALKKMDTQLRLSLRSLTTHLPLDDRASWLNRFSDAHQRYVLGLKTTHALVQKRDRLVLQTLDKIGPQIAHDIEQVKQSVVQEQDQLGPRLKARAQNSSQMTWWLSMAAILIGGLAASWLTLSITRPIRQAVDAANRLSDGDLTMTISASGRDETGQLLNAVNGTVKSLKGVITTIAEASTSLSSSAEQLNSATLISTRGTQQQEVETELVATAMNQMSATVHHVADNAASAASSAEQANTAAQTGNRVVQDTMVSIHALASKVNEASERLEYVNQEASNIGLILDVIKDIADQTNLLALNAAIEAARAGDQGRGFAVVGDEVRSLAKRTQDSTLEIQTLIDQLQQGTHSAVSTMQEGQQQAQDSVSKVNKAGESLQAIIRDIAVINDMSNQIAHASREQSEVAEAINENVMNVKRIAQDNATHAGETLKSSDDIERLAINLSHLIEKFEI